MKLRPIALLAICAVVVAGHVRCGPHALRADRSGVTRSEGPALGGAHPRLPAVAPASAAAVKGPCGDAATSAMLLRTAPNQWRFKVEATFDVPPQRANVLYASHHFGGAVGDTESAVFFFSNWRKPELVISLVNGCLVDGKLWFFISAATTRPWTVTVYECLGGAPCEQGPSRTWLGTGKLISVLDKEALQCAN